MCSADCVVARTVGRAVAVEEIGHEGAGVVADVGEGVRELKPGDPVITPFVSMCGHCAYCQSGRPQLCAQSLQALYTLPDGTVRTRDR